MANLTITGKFFNVNVGAVTTLLFLNDVPVADNPPGTIVSPNPDTEADDFSHQMTLPTGVYQLDVDGGTDGSVVLTITGAGFTLDHPCPPKYDGAIDDTYQITVA